MYIQGAWNYERMLGLGYCFCMVPFARKFLKTKKARAEFLQRNLQFFNTHPYMTSWILGAVLKLEGADNSLQTDPGQIERFKRRLSSSLAAVGDQLFWKQLKPIAAMLGLLTGLYFKMYGVFILLLVYNIPHFFMRVRGLLVGYKKGFEVIKITSINKYAKLINRLNLLAATILGMLFVFLGYETVDGKISEAIAFVVGAILMFSFLKMNLSVPLSLITLSLLSLIVAKFV